MRNFFKIFIYIFFFSNAIFNNCTFASVIVNNINNSLANIIEPLLPTVVNIYSTQNIKSNKKSFYNSPFEGFNDLFEQFGIPFEFEEMYNNPKAVSLGSGFIIDSSGYIVTNYHVISNAEEINVKLNDNTELQAELIGNDPKTDIALLKIKYKGKLVPVEFADSNAIRVGDYALAIGNPFGLGGTVTVGIVSSKSRDVIEGTTVDNFIQTDASINKGNSGGPLFNSTGNVIGMCTAIYSPSGGNVGIGFAIPSNTVKKIVKQLKETGKIVRGVLSIIVQDITKEIAEGLDLKEEYKGVLVTDVEKGGAGDKAGIKPGDVIIEFNGTPIKTIRKLQVLVAETPVNQSITLKVVRRGQVKQLSVNILAESVTSSKNILNDVVFSNLSYEHKQKFEASNGIIVTEIGADSTWYKLLRKGDIIISVNQEPINSVNEFKKIYELSKTINKKNIVVMVKRGSNITLFLSLPIN